MDFEKFTDRARGFVQAAQTLALREGHQQFTPEHLLKVLLDDPEGLPPGLIDRSGGRSGEALAGVEKALAAHPKMSGSSAGQVYLAPALARVFDQAEKVAQKAGDSYVTVERLLLALALDKDSEAGKILARAGVTPQALSAAIEALRKGRTADSTLAEPTFDALTKYARSLTQAARDGKFDPVIGRSGEIRRAIQVLSQRSKNNPILVDEPGVGKSAIVRALATRIVSGDVPDTLADKQVFAIDMGALISGTKYRGEVEERLTVMLQEAVAVQGGVILFIDDMHSLIAGGTPDSTAQISNLLRPALDRGELQFIGTTTPEGYRSCLQTDGAFMRLLQPISVSEPTIDDALSILRGLKDRFEQHHGVRIADAALVAAVTLSHRHFANRFLPDKAIDLIDEAAARLTMQIDSKPDELDSLDQDIARLVSEQAALRWENDTASKERRHKIANELAELEPRSRKLASQWRLEKERLSQALRDKTELDLLRVELSNAQRRGEYQRAGELAYGRIPELEKKLKAIEASGVVVEQVVTADHVARALSEQVGMSEDKVQNGKIFISYRRADSAGHAGRVHDRLQGEFGRDLLFMDVDSVSLGVDFVKVLRAAVMQCEVLLAVIGPNWVDARNERGARRLDDPNDFVRVEIATALERDIPEIPILLDGTAVPQSDQLPVDLKGLAIRNGLQVRHASFHSDVEKLIKALRSRPRSA